MSASQFYQVSEKDHGVWPLNKAFTEDFKKEFRWLFESPEVLYDGVKDWELGPAGLYICIRRMKFESFPIGYCLEEACKKYSSEYKITANRFSDLVTVEATIPLFNLKEFNALVNNGAPALSVFQILGS